MLSIQKTRGGDGWSRIPAMKYQISKVNKEQQNLYNEEGTYSKQIYYSLSFEYTFECDNDEVHFAYSLPYTFTMVTNLMTIMADQ